MKNKNIDLMKLTLKEIVNSPETHNQDSWISFQDEMCHTTMCVAGHAAVLAGAEVPNRKHYVNVGWLLDDSGQLLTQEEAQTSIGMTASWFARRELGLNDDEQNYIFYCMDRNAVIARMEQLIDLWEQGREFDYDHNEVIHAGE